MQKVMECDFLGWEWFGGNSCCHNKTLCFMYHLMRCLNASLNHNQKIVVVEGIVLLLASSKYVCFRENM